VTSIKDPAEGSGGLKQRFHNLEMSMEARIKYIENLLGASGEDCTAQSVASDPNMPSTTLSKAGRNRAVSELPDGQSGARQVSSSDRKRLSSSLLASIKDFAEGSGGLMQRLQHLETLVGNGSESSESSLSIRVTYVENLLGASVDNDTMQSVPSGLNMPSTRQSEAEQKSSLNKERAS
jgi:hypothetical protein